MDEKAALATQGEEHGFSGRRSPELAGAGIPPTSGPCFGPVDGAVPTQRNERHNDPPGSESNASENALITYSVGCKVLSNIRIQRFFVKKEGLKKPENA